jgi:hypothetical protein
VRKVLRAAFLFYLFVVLGWTSTALATSVVVKVEKDRIILAADTRRKGMSSDASNSHDFHDDTCKIAPLGRVGFAIAGYYNHNEKSPTDRAEWSWSAYEDARTSYRLHPNNITEMAGDWGAREIEIFKTLYSLHSSLVQKLAHADNSTPLVIGHFAGWDNEGRPTLILEMIVLNKGPFALLNQPFVLNPIVAIPVVFHERDLPYSTNNYTEDLIEHDPAKASATAKEWSVRSKVFPEPQRDWRWLEFLIQSTAPHDEEVGKDVDVLEIKASGSKWLHNSACATHLNLQKPVPLH